VLAGAGGEAGGEAGPLTGKIVLLGGLYRAARDEYLTPVGPRAGVELVAQSVESELSGGGVRTTNEALMVALEILGGVLMVYVYSRFRLGTALVASMVGIPFLALVFSFTSFSSVGRWASFIPTMVAVLLHQLHHHAVEYRRLYLQAAGMSASCEGGVPALDSPGGGKSPPADDDTAPA
jgi:CHASE2 domain-containing sensor protein